MTYSPQEIKEILGVHKNTVHSWLKEGLPKIDNQKPYLIYGHDLYEFLKQRKKKRHKKCQPNEMYCVKCQKPQQAWENVVDLIIYNDKQLMIQSLCAVCSTQINKLGSVRHIDNYKNQFVVQEIHQPRIIDTSNASSTCDKKGTS